MYNRYTPTTQGGFRRQTIAAEPSGGTHHTPPVPPQTTPRAPSAAKPPLPMSPPLRALTGGLDRGDALVLLILLLLLMEGNEDATTVVMTLAIYLLLQE